MLTNTLKLAKLPKQLEKGSSVNDELLDTKAAFVLQTQTLNTITNQHRVEVFGYTSIAVVGQKDGSVAAEATLVPVVLALTSFKRSVRRATKFVSNAELVTILELAPA